VPRESLSDPDVSSRAIDIAATCVAQTVKVEPPLKPGALLPHAEGVPELARREATAIAAEKQRCGFGGIFAFAFFPAKILIEFISQNIGKKNLLAIDVRAASLEYSKLNPTASPAIGIENIANVQRKDLMLPKSRAQGHTEDHVISKAASVFAAHLK